MLQSVAVQLWLQSLPSRLATGASASTLERVKEVTLEELERLEAYLCSLRHGYENEHAIAAAAGETAVNSGGDGDNDIESVNAADEAV